MKRLFNILSRLIGVLLISLTLGLSGCATVIPVQNQIPFNEARTGSGELKVVELTMNYSYQQVGSDMTFNAVLTSAWKYNSITVRLYFFDKNGNVLQQKIVYFSTVRSSLRSGLAFESSLVVPPKAVGISLKMTANRWFDQ